MEPMFYQGHHEISQRNAQRNGCFRPWNSQFLAYFEAGEGNQVEILYGKKITG